MRSHVGQKLYCWTNYTRRNIEIARYDSGLHEPHLDIIGPDGGKKRIIDYSILENDQALNVTIQDFKNNWNIYIERWNKWYEEKK